MSRREDRSSDARRHRSRFDREPSPKRSRRDDNKQERERLPVNTKLDNDRDSDRKHHRQLRDPPPLQPASAHDSKIETRTMNKDTDNRTIGPLEITKKISDPAKVPQPRLLYSRHDEVAGAGQNGRAFNRSMTDREHGSWRDHKEHQNSRTEVKKAVASDVKNEKPRDGRYENRPSRHDEYFRTEANPALKRPAFREQKIPAVDSEKIEKTATDSEKKIQNQRGAESGRRDERRFNSERSGRHERSSFVRDKELTRGEAMSNSRDRYGGGLRSGYRGREGFSGVQGFDRPAGGRVEKWKHDLYDEANRSPKAKNEEEQISKIEALLAS
ncbi:hypothetical protein CASFOL_042419 [Castilleja foliolosa]|uniref:Btz domain-containing protein n=1 Tax=Castilleja foliolosa TaxID=1961234 RepID=A0ABD3BAG0_9LAMI